MVRVAISKMTGALATIVGASLISFLLLRILPGNPARLIAGPLAPESAVEGIIREMGLDKPIHMQYIQYVTDFMQGDWGFSFSAGKPVRDLIIMHLPATAELALFAFLFATIGAMTLALLATYKSRPTVDRIVRSVSSFGLGIPQFWLALLLLMLMFEYLGILPGPNGRLDLQTIAPPGTTGFFTIDSILAGQFDLFIESITYLILPMVSLGFGPLSYLTRLLRANLLEVSREPFILVVRSKGITRWITFIRHALPNAILPTLTASGLVLAELLTGSVLVEKIFSWPGIGSLVVDSILRQDYAVAQAFFLLSASAYVFVNMVIDTLYGVIDPRTRIESVAAR